MSQVWIAAILWHLIIVLGGLAALFHLYLALKRWPLIGWLVLGGFVAIASDFPYLPSLVTVSSISIYPQDLMIALLALDLVRRIPKLRAELHGTRAAWTGFLVFMGVSLVAGISSFGLGTTGNEARATLQLLVGTAWAMSQMSEPGFIRRLERFIYPLGAALTAVALYHIATRGLGKADVMILQNGAEVTNRPLVAEQALILCLLGLYGVMRRRHVPLSVVFVVVAVLCQHRSVWAALGATVVVLALIGRPTLRWRLLQLSVVAVLGVVLLWTFGLLGDLPSKISYDLHSRGTLNGRTFAFDTLISEQNKMGPLTVLHGQPWGTGFERTNAAGAIEAYTPHDWYVLLYLRVGVLGAGLMVWIMIVRLLRHLRSRNDVQLGWLITIGVFALAYHLTWYVGPFLGLVLARSVLPSTAEPECQTVSEASLSTAPVLVV